MVSKSFCARVLLIPLAASATAQQPYSSSPPPNYPPPPAYQAPPAGYQGPQQTPQPGYQAPVGSYSYPAQPAYPAPQTTYAPPAGTYPPAPGAYRPPAQSAYAPAGSAPPQGYPAAAPPPPPPANGYAPSQQAVAAPGWQQGAPAYSSVPQSAAPPQGLAQPGSAVVPLPGAQPLPNYTPVPGQAAIREPELAIEPYRKHEDTHHGHDQVYPDRGAVVRDLPRAASVVNYAGSSYWFADGVWFEPRGPAFVVTAPPIGLIVPTLPAFATAIVSAGRAYLYANDVYYRPRPDLGGYEVVNDPEEPVVDSGGTASAAGTALGITAAPAGPQLTNAAAVSTTGAAPVATAAVASVGPPGGTGNSPYFYPHNGQSPDEQARDRYDCYRFAVAQTGFDPMRVSPGTPAAQYADRQGAYDRAQTTCYEGRGYTAH